MKKRGNRARRQHRRQWLEHRARKKFLNPRTPTYYSIKDFTQWSSYDQIGRARIRKIGEGKVEIDLCERMDFEENYEEAVGCLRVLRDAVDRGLFIKTLRFENLHHISPAAALVLASEVDRWRQGTKSKYLRANVHLWKPEISALLAEMGYFELLGIQRPQLPNVSKPVTFIAFMSGSSGNEGREMAKRLRIKIENLVGRKVRKQVIFEGLSEAITNVRQHAYPEAGQDRRRWWLSASFNHETQELIVMFYDQGVGIPNTIGIGWMLPYVAEFLGIWTDAKKIEAAAGYGESRTKLPQRGKGMTNFNRFAETYDDGRLSIFSNRGLFRIVFRDNNQHETVQDHARSIRGTLIEWAVKL